MDKDDLIPEDNIPDIKKTHSGHSHYLPEVVQFQDFLDSNRRNIYYDEFGFDIDVFENLCADFNPEEDIMLCLSKDRATLDKFCYKVYGMNYHDTYMKLSGISKALMRRCYNKLAKAGNATAMNIQQTYMKVAQESEGTKPISIIVDINKKEN